MAGTVRFTYSRGAVATWQGAGVWRVLGMEGVTAERRGRGWLICCGGEALLGIYSTLAEALGAIGRATSKGGAGGNQQGKVN
jgi:hypothetical protein